MSCPTCGESSPPDAKFCGKCGSALESSAAPAEEVISDRYRIVECIGKGAMGTVYRAEHVQLGKAMAVKLLHRDLEQNPENVARFHREAEAASRLNHPNTVHVFDFGTTESGSLFLAMEYVEGEDLGKIIAREGAMPFGRVAYICALVAGSVADAHAAGVIHRDLKPENIVVTHGRDGDRPKVLDFGLAKLFEGSLGTQITGAGTIVGTPFYMSPEQIQGKELHPRSDVYALGSIMYECVVGQPLFEAPSPVGILTKHLSEEPPAPSTRSPLSVPSEADDIILRCLAKNPEDRFQTAEALRQALIDYLTTVGSEDWRMAVEGGSSSRNGMRRLDGLDAAPPRKRRPWLWLGAVALVAAGVAAWQWSQRGPAEQEPNHLPSEATPLAQDVDMEAYLGKRLRQDMGDVDLFAIRHAGPERAAEIEVTSIPNMDVVVELLGPDAGSPVVVSDSKGLGQGEHLPNVPLSPGRWLIRVREKPLESALPTENVSDAYTVRWSVLPDDASFEVEPNDSLERAEALALGSERRAWIGWAGDVDTFCLENEAEAVIAQVSALAEVDLILRVVDPDSDRSRKIDEKGTGRGETSKPWHRKGSGRLCIEVSADGSDALGRSAQPDATYGVRFIQAPR